MILVTGGAGYIGSHINKELNLRGDKTIVYDNLSNGHKELVKWGIFEQGDLRDQKQLLQVFKKWPIEAVMHFAACIEVGESVLNPQKYYYNNVVGTLNLLSTMLEANVKTIVFSSSCATYGIPQKIPIPEDHSQNPINPYGWTKLMMEKIIEDCRMAYGVNYCSLRYFNAAGADFEGEIGEWHTPETHLIPLILETALGKRAAIKIYGTDYDTKDGTCIRDYIHVTDLANAHVLALDYLRGGGHSDSFNLGNGNGFSVKQVIEEARRITKKPIKAEESDRRAGDVPFLIGTSEKIRKTLGWSPKYTSLEDIISTAWAWHRNG